jgi:anti-sigma regulatory factor (Ser/Thr protein kinase)
MLMVSELVTNAVVHGEGPIDLRIERLGDRVRIAVTDHGTGTPVEDGMPDSDAVHGRGLAIVARLAQRWGVRAHQGAGTTVWFECRVRPSTARV